jgi:CDP-diacylglycerol---serine O-phosphatidyltransferase
VVYLLTLPWGWKSYRAHERNAAAAQAAATTDVAAPTDPASAFPAPPAEVEHDDRPARLN